MALWRGGSQARSAWLLLESRVLFNLLRAVVQTRRIVKQEKGLVEKERRFLPAQHVLSCSLLFWVLFDTQAVLAAPPEKLSAQAAADIRALLQEKASWTPAQSKLDSALIHAAKRNRGQPFAAPVSRLQQDVQFEKDGSVLVDIKGKVTSALLRAITDGGGTLVSSVPQLESVRATLTLDQLEAMIALPEVKSIRRAVKCATNTGSVDSQGDA